MNSKYDKCPTCDNKKDVRAIKCRRCHDRTPYSELLEQGATKLCKGCNRELPMDSFSERRTRKTIKARSRCKECEVNSAKNYRKSNPEKVRSSKYDWYHNNPDKGIQSSKRKFARKLGYSEEDIKVIMDRFSETKFCDICGDSINITGTLHLDHCHKTNKFRGFICGNCNTGLGQFKDCQTRLSKAIEYLDKFKDPS